MVILSLSPNLKEQKLYGKQYRKEAMNQSTKLLKFEAKRLGATTFATAKLEDGCKTVLETSEIISCLEIKILFILQPKFLIPTFNTCFLLHKFNLEFFTCSCQIKMAIVCQKSFKDF